MIKKFKKAFTITELVIVIAVIAILAAVLIPTFSTVISKANESAAMQECRNEWSNMSVEVLTEENAPDGYMLQINKGGDDYYFVVINSEFVTDPVSLDDEATTVVVGTTTVTYETVTYNIAEYDHEAEGAYQKANTDIIIYTLTKVS